MSHYHNLWLKLQFEMLFFSSCPHAEIPCRRYTLKICSCACQLGAVWTFTTVKNTHSSQCTQARTHIPTFTSKSYSHSNNHNIPLGEKTTTIKSEVPKYYCTCKSLTWKLKFNSIQSECCVCMADFGVKEAVGWFWVLTCRAGLRAERRRLNVLLLLLQVSGSYKEQRGGPFSANHVFFYHELLSQYTHPTSKTCVIRHREHTGS